MNEKHVSSRGLKWNSRMRYLLYGVLVLALLGGGFYLIRWWQGEKPNILLISIDTLRRDHCTPYGYERNTTPSLQMLAEQGALFDLAYAPSATTAPSHATMLTSLYPIGHQVLNNGWILTEKAYTLAEHLGSHGYQTAAFVSSSVLDRKFGFAQGFTFYDDDFSSSQSTVHQKLWDDLPEGLDRRADDTTGKVIDWLKQHRDPEQPFFLFIHYFDPHDPYVPPKQILSEIRPRKKRLTKLERQILKYDGEVKFTDREIGKLLGTLKQLSLQENTLVVVTSDHGEGLGQHGHMHHSINIYEEQVRVPLIVRYPAVIPAGARFNEPVELVDLIPTILDLSNVSSNGFSFQGKSLAKVLQGKATLDADRPVYLYRKKFNSHCRKDLSGKPIWLDGDKYGIRWENWKYIEGKAEKTLELFNLAEDPFEHKNITNTFPGKGVELSAHIKDWKKEKVRLEADDTVISDEDLRRLEALGYIADAPHSPDTSNETDSDKDGIKDYMDNCPCVRNQEQRDQDGDGFGNVCDEKPNDPKSPPRPDD